MVILTAAIQAKPGMEKELEQVLLGMVGKVKAEEGALEYRLHKSRTTEGKFLFYEKYTDQAALDLHESTSYYKEMGEKLGPLTKGGLELDTFEFIDGIPEGE